MESFKIFVDNKETVWRRDIYVVQAENREEAISLIKDQFEEDGELEESDNVEFRESNLLHETETNTGEIEVFFEDDDDTLIYEHKG